MAETLPYLTSAGSLKTALDRIKTAATPERVYGDFVTNTLQMKGGTGAAITPYLKRIGFVAPDGTPTEIYKKFRNDGKIGKQAAADAVIFGYKELSQVNESFYKLNQSELRSLILQVTGLAADSRVSKLIQSTLSILMSYADFSKSEHHVEHQTAQQSSIEMMPTIHKKAQLQDDAQIGLNLSYTINLNLPATTDQAVFNAIFRSLKEHLLSNNE